MQKPQLNLQHTGTISLLTPFTTVTICLLLIQASGDTELLIIVTKIKASNLPLDSCPISCLLALRSPFPLLLYYTLHT